MPVLFAIASRQRWENAEMHDLKWCSRGRFRAEAEAEALVRQRNSSLSTVIQPSWPFYNGFIPVPLKSNLHEMNSLRDEGRDFSVFGGAVGTLFVSYLIEASPLKK